MNTVAYFSLKWVQEVNNLHVPCLIEVMAVCFNPECIHKTAVCACAWRSGALGFTFT